MKLSAHKPVCECRQIKIETRNAPFGRISLSDRKNLTMSVHSKAVCLAILGAAMIPGSLSSLPMLAQPAAAQAAPAKGATRLVGAVTAVNGQSITIKLDNGSEATFTVDDDTRMLQAAPGQKDLSSATPIHVTDLQVGDRVLARATAGDDGKYTASTLIAMKQSDIAQKQAHERQDWQRRGVGGLVKSVDPASGTIVVAASEAGAPKAITIHAGPKTVVRRYAPDSVKFDDAKPSTVDQVKAGDQLRARGDRSADGSEVTAEEIVAGSFRNVAATVQSVDTAAGTLTLTDLATKKPVVIGISADSQLRRLPPAMAQGIAARLKSQGASGPAATSTGRDGAGASPPGPPSAARPATEQGPDSGRMSANQNQPRGTAGPNGGRGGDTQQMLAHAPAIQLADLKKGDAVMVVATEGSPTNRRRRSRCWQGWSPCYRPQPAPASR